MENGAIAGRRERAVEGSGSLDAERPDQREYEHDRDGRRESDQDSRDSTRRPARRRTHGFPLSLLVVVRLDETVERFGDVRIGL